jgi:hypothetical protein
VALAYLRRVCHAAHMFGSGYGIPLDAMAQAPASSASYDQLRNAENDPAYLEYLAYAMRPVKSGEMLYADDIGEEKPVKGRVIEPLALPETSA